MLLLACACGNHDAKPIPAPAPAPPPQKAAPTVHDAPAAADYPDLGAALTAIIPPDARVIGFGELHSRTDRAQVTSALAHFTNEALPALEDKLSDLIVETWVTDPHCGSAAQEATTKVTVTMRRPVETKSEIAKLADAARAAGIQPHAMKLTCDDYARIAPPGKDVQVEVMLDLTTRELKRIATEAVTHRDAEPHHRPWIALYGGALHNDRFPDKGVEDWSYAKTIDDQTHGHFVEVDLIVPELADDDPQSQKQPWFDLVKHAARHVQVYSRGERSFVVILARS